MSITEDFLASVQIEKRSQFEAQRTVLSFQGYLEEVVSNPQRHIRNAAQYFLDMVNHFGSEERDYPTGPERRFSIFDCAIDSGEGRVVGQERVQNVCNTITQLSPDAPLLPPRAFRYIY